MQIGYVIVSNAADATISVLVVSTVANTAEWDKIMMITRGVVSQNFILKTGADAKFPRMRIASQLDWLARAIGVFETHVVVCYIVIIIKISSYICSTPLHTDVVRTDVHRTCI